MFGKRNVKTPVSRRKKILLILALSIIALLIGAVTAIYFLFASKLQNTFGGNPIDAITNNQPLKSTDGRTNFLVFGTSYDDPNPSHTGGYLTDSLIVLSVDKSTKTTYTISIPRDLWVNYDTSCNVGESGKINATYVCAINSYGESENEKASKALTDKISGVLGIPIQYYIQVNYTLIQSLTDALGGIDVDIYSSDERGIYDPNVGLKLPAGVNHVDGKTALKLARARNAAGGYGLPRSNFDREINQQRIITAIFKKLSSKGTLSDIGASLKLIDALGKEVRTNIQTSEIRSGIETAQALNVKKFISVPLVDYLVTDSINGQSIVRPTTGLNDYTAIQMGVAEKLKSGDIK